jgi:hypothetical protein
MHDMAEAEALGCLESGRLGFKSLEDHFAPVSGSWFGMKGNAGPESSIWPLTCLHFLTL